MQHVANDAESVVREKRRDLVLVVLNLLVCVLVVGFSARRRLQFKKNKRQAIHKYNYVRSFVGAVLDIRPLVDDVKSIIVGIVEVDKTNDIGMVLDAVKPSNFDAILQHVHERTVFTNERATFDFFELGYCCVDGVSANGSVDCLK